MKRNKTEDAPCGGASYVRVATAWLLDHAHDCGFSLPRRIEFAAWARANRSGHAQFAAGELALILGRKGKDGWEAASSSSVSRALRKAREGGWIEPGSSARCIVVDRDRVDQGRQGGYGCRHHRIAAVEPVMLSPAA